jgi:hypothetical protein
MKPGLFTPVFNNRSLMGRWKAPGTVYAPGKCRANRCVSPSARRRGLGISALSCHGNAVHPDEAIAGRDDRLFRQTVELAEQMEVPVVETLSGRLAD